MVFLSFMESAQAPAGIKYCGNGRKNANNAGQSDTFDDHFLLRDQSQSTGNVEVEHQPDADEDNRLGLDDIDGFLTLFLFCRLMPAGRFGQKQMTYEHHDKINGSKDEEHRVDAFVGIRSIFVVQ